MFYTELVEVRFDVARRYAERSKVYRNYLVRSARVRAKTETPEHEVTAGACGGGYESEELQP